MNNFDSQNLDQAQYSSIVDDDNFENDDLVTFQHDSKTINIFYSQIAKYSKHIRESYLFSDVVNRLPQEIYRFQEEFQLLPENIDLFFQLLQQNYNIKEDLILTYIQCIDLLKISKFLEVRKLSSKITQYIKSNKVNVDFIIQMIQYDVKMRRETENQQIIISKEIEQLLTSKIDECFSNENFKELPIEIIYRIIEKSSPNMINSNKLFDIIIKSVNRFCVLFPFLELQKLSENRLSVLCEMYSKSNENTRHYFDYLKCNLDLINEISNRKKNLEEMNDEHQNKMKDLETKIISLQTQFNGSEQRNDQLQNQLNDSKELINEQQNKMNDLEKKIASLQNQFNDSEKINEQLQKQLNDSTNLNNEQTNKIKDLETLLQKQLNDSENLNNEQANKINDLEALLQKQSNESEKINEQLQNQLNYSKDLENQISQLQKQQKENSLIKGQIVASVENGFLINAEINLKTKSSTLDTSKSKVIISTSDCKNLGIEAYEKGEPITSLHMQTTFVCKPGSYYVRCILFNSEGESNEILSNSVTTSTNSLTFGYEGKPAEISLPQGQYILEVWGAKGGNGTSTGNGTQGTSTAQGGLGGYSRGILNLKQKETIYVFVGGEGCTSNPSEGSVTEGGFPDGGGTKTGLCGGRTVPGTGGGSTSIRIGSDTNYTRVIVAGGGGGASGCCYSVDPGGFGGGLNGGNCYFEGSIQNKGAGTQNGSTSGLGWCCEGNKGEFGSGAAGGYMIGTVIIGLPLFDSSNFGDGFSSLHLTFPPS